MINKKNLNISDKDTLIKISSIIDKINLTKNKDIPFVTCFLTPLELSITLDILNKNFIKYKVFGGYNNATRNKVCFYVFESEYNFNIDIIKITYNKKFSRELSHSDFLGSILGLGISRDLVGDIIINNSTYIFLDNSISDYILANYEYVGKTKVKVEKNNEFQLPIETKEIANFSFSSLRIDTVISSVFNISRNTSKELIEKDRVFRNYMVVNNCNKTIEEGDIISVRSYGKFQFIEETGTTKKGKVRGDIFIY